MAAKKKSNRIRLVSTATLGDGRNTGTFKVVKKGPEQEGKIKKKMFDRKATHPITGKLGCHVFFEEKKIK